MSRRFRICMAKGGRESARPSYGRPKLTLISRRRKKTKKGVPKSWAVPILTLEQNPPERIFLTYIKIFSQEDFALKSKLRPANFLLHLPIFAGNSHFTGISQLRAGKTRAKRPRSHCLSTMHLLPYIGHHLTHWTHPDISLRFRAGGRRVKNFRFFTNFHFALVKKFVSLLLTQF